MIYLTDENSAVNLHDTMTSTGRKRPISDDEDGDEDYRKRRDRNNEAVKRSRFKSKQKTQETQDRVSKLKSENEILEEKVKTLTKELSFLKELFLAHASNSKDSKFEGINVEKLLEDIKDETDDESKT